MKSLYAFLALACAGALPACTVNRYYAPGYGPGYGPGGVREYHTTDTVYVNTGSTTIINQSGTVGGPQGGYAANGPGRTTPPPLPPPRTNGPAGTYPPPRTNPSAGTYPPPRTNPPRNTGVVRNPSQPTQQPPAGPGRQPTAGTTPPPATQPPAGGQPGTGPTRTPGATVTPPPAGSGNPITPAPGTLGSGINTPGGTASGGTSTMPAGNSGNTNGGGTSSNPGGAVGTPVTTPGGSGSSGSTPNGTPGGGIPTSTGGTIVVGGGNTAGGGIRTGGIKPSRNNQWPTTTNENPAPADYPTGGIKPIPPTPSQPTTSTPGNLGSTPTGLGQTSGGIRAGGIKPSRINQLPTTTNENPAPADYPTGGIKPIPGTATPGAEPTAAGTPGEIIRGPIRTGGIKPSRNVEVPVEPSLGGGRVVTGGGGGLTTTPGGTVQGTTATPALMFSKMPCRGTCPSYTATIWPNGRVVYVGQQNVTHIGSYELKLDPSKVAAMQQQAQQARFSRMLASYTNGATDIPATVLTMYDANGSSKTVTVEDGAPAEVQALFDYINGTINQLVAGSQFPEQRTTQRRGR